MLSYMLKEKCNIELLQRNVWSPLPNIIFGVTGMVGGLSLLRLPETFNTKMPENLEEAEQFGE